MQLVKYPFSQLKRNNLALRRSFTLRKVCLFAAVCILAVVCVLLSAEYLPPASGIDWRETYRPASLALLSGESPYDHNLNNPPWALLPLLPFALLPLNLGRAMLFLIGFGCFAWVGYRMGAKPAALLALLLSPPVFHSLYNSNIDWLVLVGLVLPVEAGLFFMTIKPQIGSVVVLYWLFEAWREGGMKRVVKKFGPVTLATLVSFAFFGFWPERFFTVLGYSRNLNDSLWPGSLPIGLFFLVSALRHRKIRHAMIASPLLSPYVLLHAWSGALVAVLPSTIEAVSAVIGLWILVILGAMH